MPHRLLLATVLALLATAAPAAAAHPHYEALLREGTYALDRGEIEQAVRQLRLACFGFLEEPPALCACLARLALAQAAAGDDDAFRDTFRRVVEVEERFGAYTGGGLAPELRAAFEAEVRARVPPALLESTSAFAALAAAREEAAPGELAAAAPDQAGEPGGTAAAEAPEPGDPTGPPGAVSVEPPAPALGADDLARLARARELMAAGRTRPELEEPFRLAREVADANPSSRQAQHLAAEIAYRAARWDEAVRYFRRGGDPGEGTPELLFYLAVSLYEAGETEAAAEALRRSLPRIEQTPFVRSYRARILGQGTEARPPGGRR